MVEARGSELVDLHGGRACACACVQVAHSAIVPYLFGECDGRMMDSVRVDAGLPSLTT